MKPFIASAAILLQAQSIKINSEHKFNPEFSESDEQQMNAQVSEVQKGGTIGNSATAQALEQAIQTLNVTGQSASKSEVDGAIKDASEEQSKAGKFQGNITIANLLKKSKDENELVENLLSRKDGLNHLLLTDQTQLMNQMAKEFPEYAQVEPIGKSFEGRDINLLTISAPNKADKPAIFMTGATHARELITSSVNMYQAVKLLQQGVVNKDAETAKLLEDNKFYFVPTLNVDGVALIEENWAKNKTITPIRKNRDDTVEKTTQGLAQLQNEPLEAEGVDLNRNFPVNFAESSGHPDYVKTDEDSWMKKGPADDSNIQISQKSGDDALAPKVQDNSRDPRSMYFQGSKPFSEPETQAYRDFLTKHQDEVKFVLNMHSNGNAFIWPFNGVKENDIEKRAPGVMNIFQKIKKEAPFPYGEQFGNSQETMAETVGGDQDDWTLSALGIPAVTSEIGYVGQFIDEWKVVDAMTAKDIMVEQSNWINYLYNHLGEISKMEVDAKKQAKQIKSKPKIEILG